MLTYQQIVNNCPHKNVGEEFYNWWLYKDKQTEILRDIANLKGIATQEYMDAIKAKLDELLKLGLTVERVNTHGID